MGVDSAIQVFKGSNIVKEARNTIVSEDAFQAELTQIIEQSYSLDNEEWFDDMIDAAVPITNTEGTSVAYLSTHALVTRKTLSQLRDEIPLMLSAVEELKDLML